MYIRLENSNNKNLVGAKDMFLTVEIPNLLPDALQSTPEEFARQAKMAMAVKLYEMGKISSGIAAGMLNMERVHFLLQLGEYGVPMIDLSLEELESDIRNA